MAKRAENAPPATLLDKSARLLRTVTATLSATPGPAALHEFHEFLVQGGERQRIGVHGRVAAAPADWGYSLVDPAQARLHALDRVQCTTHLVCAYFASLQASTDEWVPLAELIASELVKLLDENTALRASTREIERVGAMTEAEATEGGSATHDGFVSETLQPAPVDCTGLDRADMTHADKMGLIGHEGSGAVESAYAQAESARWSARRPATASFGFETYCRAEVALTLQSRATGRGRTTTAGCVSALGSQAPRLPVIQGGRGELRAGAGAGVQSLLRGVTVCPRHVSLLLC